ncbi:hypothetical protein [Ramlibacter algicola]|uniref:Uncharacterized protein n=1 Tax=Ramlibacter algicola TaxID=2795217 RepID=A0A934PZE5_9BURK|nr:hypothetical protein [Ramlibacter algicola]MBK0391908.1 hypothetical protein [Ramlibacter algicola]
MLRQAAAGAALVAAAAAVLLWEPAIDHEPARLVPRALAVAARVGIAPQGTPDESRPVATQVPRTSLAAAYARATDVRQFVLEAMQRPGDGGLFYARIALQNCSGADHATMDAAIRRVIELTGTVSADQMRVADAAVRRCASFQGREAHRLFERAVLQSRDGSDPLVNAERGFGEALAAGDRDRVRAAVVRILDLGDPHLQVLLLRTARRASAAHESSGDAPGEGQPLDAAQVDEVLSGSAIALAACRDGLSCDYDAVMHMECLGAGLCAGSREAHVRAWLALGGIAAQDIDRLPALVTRARRAMDEKDVDFFLR